jgi:mono/diheme cytochrome c family protein
MSRPTSSTLGSVRRAFLLLGATLVCSAAGLHAQETTGDADRGRTLFNGVYKCYACHGFDAQTGARRLKPMNYTEEGFTTFVQNSPLQQMPRYPDASDAQLADIYAYILSIPVDAPDVGDIPLLEEILDAKLSALDE